MTVDLDTLARSAAADLRRRTERVDTEAALATLHRSAGTGRHRVRRLVPSGRTFAVAAAAIALLAALALTIGTRDDGGTERLGTQTTEPIDPTTYGPLLGTLHGVDDPGLTAEVYGPQPMDDGAEVAVAITGGRPGQRYHVNQCAVSDEDYNPASNCTIGKGAFSLDEAGNGVRIVAVRAVFDGAGTFARNDCRVQHCELQITPALDDSEAEPAPGTLFAVQPELAAARSDSPWVPVELRSDTPVSPLPAITATFLSATPDGIRVRLEGIHLKPGLASVKVAGYDGPRSGMLAHVPSAGPTTIGEVDVPPSGELSTEVVLPSIVRERSSEGTGSDPVDCGGPQASCEVWVIPQTLGDDDGHTPMPVIAEPVRYPEPR